MNAYYYADNERQVKKSARSAVNLVALIALISTMAGIVFYAAVMLLEPLIVQLISSAVYDESLGNEMYAKAFGESFVMSSEYNWFISVISTLLCSFLPFAVLSKKLLNMDFSQSAPLNGKVMKSFPFIYCASLMMSGVASSVTGGVFSFLFPDSAEAAVADTVSIYGSSESVFSLVLCFFAMCVVAPFAEEFIYRGVIFGFLRKFGFSFAAFASSLIFGLAHATASQIAYAFVFGLALCMIYERTGNLKTSILMHFINNLIGYVQAYILPLTGSENAQIIFESVYNIFVGVFAVIGMFLMFSGKKRKDEAVQSDSGEGICREEEINAPLSCVMCAGMVFVILYSVFNILMGMVAYG